MKKIVFRIDDVGASSKKFEIYSKKIFGNFLFLKRLPIFKAWGPYEELSLENWKEILNYIGENNYKLTIAVTASWVDEKNIKTPFFEKFPAQANIIYDHLKYGNIEIVNHGLTHCVVGRHLPHFFSSNRKFHREFWEWVPYEVQHSNLIESCNIFKKWIGYIPKILVPPGNVYSKDTVKICEKLNFKAINSSKKFQVNSSIKFLDNENVFAFHDRDIVMNGMNWIKNIYKVNSKKFKFNFLHDLL